MESSNKLTYLITKRIVKHWSTEKVVRLQVQTYTVLFVPCRNMRQSNDIAEKTIISTIQIKIIAMQLRRLIDFLSQSISWFAVHLGGQLLVTVISCYHVGRFGSGPLGME